MVDGLSILQLSTLNHRLWITGERLTVTLSNGIPLKTVKSTSETHRVMAGCNPSKRFPLLLGYFGSRSGFVRGPALRRN